MPISITLEDIAPLSINKAFQGRRFKTKECKAYEEELFLFLPAEKMIKGEVEITFKFYLKFYKRTDVSNLVKILEDVLVKCGYIEDDRKVVAMHLYKYESDKNKIEIEIKKKTGL